MEEEEKVEVDESTDGETLAAGEEADTPENTAEDVDLEELKKKAKLADNYKIRAEKAETELKKKTSVGSANTVKEKTVDSVDLIKLGKKLQNYSDEELDFVTDAAGSKDPEKILKTLENPYIQAGIQGIRQKVEKEKLTLKPSSNQPESEKEITLDEAISTSSIEEQEKILREQGLYSEPERIKEKVSILRN